MPMRRTTLLLHRVLEHFFRPRGEQFEDAFYVAAPLSLQKLTLILLRHRRDLL